MNTDIHRLLFIEPPESFHDSFEHYFQLSPEIRHRFNDNILLQAIRKAYLWEYCAEQQTTSCRDKIFYYNDALIELSKVTAEPPAHIDESELLFLCHYKAKFHYQMGYQWMVLDQEMEHDVDLIEWFMNNSTLTDSQHTFVQQIATTRKRPLQHAMDCFATAARSYDPFKNQTDRNDDKDFYILSQTWHQTFADLEPYSPWARLISIACNHFLCMQEWGEDDATCTALLGCLLSRIEHHQQRVKSKKHTRQSASDTAIAEVDALLEPFKPMPESTQSKIVCKSIKAKRARSSHKNTTSHRCVVDWAPKVADREQFNDSLRKGSWIKPSFLRPRQETDLGIIYQKLGEHDIPLIVTKPTGTGKTAEFSALANAAWSNGLPTIIVVPTATLVEQTRNKLFEYKKHRDMIYNVDHIKLFCPTKKSMEIGPITIVTQASYVSQARKALNRFPSSDHLLAYIGERTNAYLEKEIFFHPDFFSLLIVDEGHHMDGDRLYDIMTRPQCHRPKIIFSASTLPGQYPRIDQKCQHIITQTLIEAIEHRELAPLQALTIDFSMYPEAKELTRSIRSRMRNKSNGSELDDVSRKEISELLCKQAGFSLTAASVLKQIIEHVPSTKKVMVFTDSIDHANLLSVLLSNVFNKPIGAFHTNEPDRDTVLSRFTRNETPIIVAVGALDEGFDDSDVNLVLDFSIYKSRVRRMLQRLGRALRLREDGSGALLVSIKLLPKDLQLIPRDEIFGTQEHSHLGFDDRSENILDETTLRLTLPEPLHIKSDLAGSFSNSIIAPQGGAIIFARNRKPSKLGVFPESENRVDEMSPVSKKRSIHEISHFFTPPQDDSSITRQNDSSIHDVGSVADPYFDEILDDWGWFI